ncbi:hypothetical protein [Sinorhizobium meliloti]|uniref:hypothetical protein n=1 Tax=Rhizobium meliloti TaxID=382 RepID=UPI00299EC971
MTPIPERFLQPASFQIQFDCPKCGEPVEDEIDDVAFDWTADRMSDGIGTVASKVYCQECGAEHDVEVIAKPGEKQVVLVKHPETVIRFHDDTFDGDIDAFLDSYIPYDAFEVYQEAHKEIGNIDLSAAGLLPVKHALLRMLYVQYVVILEAYLSDRLINLILNDNEKLIALIGTVEALRNTTPKLIEIAKDPDIVVKHVKSYLHEFSFHKFSEAAKLYRAVLGVNIFADEANAKEMDEIRVKRHHLIHRNGRDNEGKYVAVTAMEVLRVRKLVDEMVRRIEDVYQRYEFEKALEAETLPF